MGWRDRAVASVDPKDWRARATVTATHVSPPAVVAPAQRGFGDRALEAVGDAARGLGQGASFGFGDELAGGVGALIDKATGDKRSLTDLYRESRDFARGDNAGAKERSPYAYGGAELAGAMAVPVPGGSTVKGASLLSKVGRGMLAGGFVGGAASAGNTNADLTKGEYGDFAKDTGIGTVAGSGLGGGFAAAGHVAEKVGQWAKGKAAKASKDALDKGTREIEEGIASAQGKARSKTQEASRDTEVVEREAAALPETSKTRGEAEKFLDDPETLRLREQITSNKLKSAPDRMAEMQRLSDEHLAKVASRDVDIAARHKDLLANPIKRELVPRLKTYASRAIPIAVGSYAASEIGGHEGLAVGGVLGAATAAALGRPGTALANMMKSPRFRHWAAQAVERAAEGKGLIGGPAAALAPLASRAAEFGAGKVSARDEPEWLRKLRELQGVRP